MKPNNLGEIKLIIVPLKNYYSLQPSGLQFDFIHLLFMKYQIIDLNLAYSLTLVLNFSESD